MYNLCIQSYLLVQVWVSVVVVENYQLLKTLVFHWLIQEFSSQSENIYPSLNSGIKEINKSLQIPNYMTLTSLNNLPLLKADNFRIWKHQ